MAHRGQLLAVLAVTLGAAACGPKLPRIDTAWGQLPLEERFSVTARAL